MDKELLHFIKEQYHFQIYHVVSVPGGYVAETNCGSKRISLWSDLEKIKWGFEWREKMAAQGFREINRFICTKKLSPFVSYGNFYIVVQDQWKGQPVNLDKIKTWSHIGEVTGRLWTIFQHMTTERQRPGTGKPTQSQPTQATQSSPSSSFIQSTLSPAGFWEKEEVELIRYRLFEGDTLFSSLAGAHWKGLHQRYKQAQSLYETALQNTPEVWSTGPMSLEPFVMLDMGALAIAPQEREIGDGYGALAALLQDAAVRGYEEEAWEAFYKGIEQHVSAGTGSGSGTAFEHRLLAHLLQPAPFFEILAGFTNRQYSEDESVERWTEQCNRQELRDRMHLWFARRIDRKRRESMSV